MALLEITCDNLGEMNDGLARAIINDCLKRAIRDCDDRGMDDGKVRKAVITVEFKKVADATIVINVKAGVKAPDYQVVSVGHTEAATKRGSAPTLKFRSDNPERPDQPTLTGEMEND